MCGILMPTDDNDDITSEHYAEVMITVNPENKDSDEFQENYDLCGKCLEQMLPGPLNDARRKAAAWWDSPSH